MADSIKTIENIMAAGPCDKYPREQVADLPARQQELLVERAVSDSTEPGICSAYALVPGWYYDKAGTGVAWVRRDGSWIVRHWSTHRLVGDTVGDTVGAWTRCDPDPALMIPYPDEILVPRRECRVEEVRVLEWPETLGDDDPMARRAVVRRTGVGKRVGAERGLGRYTSASGARRARRKR
jgi:hypothetical protein